MSQLNSNQINNQGNSAIQLIAYERNHLIAAFMLIIIVGSVTYLIAPFFAPAAVATLTFSAAFALIRINYKQA